MKRIMLVALAVAVLGACGGPPPPGIAFGSACVPVSGTLGAGESLGGMQGSYLLIMVSGGDRTASAEGQLSLVERPAGMRTLQNSSIPLSGWTDVDVEAVGAQRVGRLRTDDLAAPGVLVIEADGSNGRTIFLRMGSDANRLDRVAIDGAYTVLSVKRIADAGFAGTWTSGVSGVTTQGYFCAQKRTG